MLFNCSECSWCDGVKDSFYEDLERILNKFPKYHMKILLGDFNAKVGREDIFRPTRNQYDNGVKTPNFAASKI
jgi:exonuclease III